VDVRVRGEDVLVPVPNSATQWVAHTSGGDFQVSWSDRRSRVRVASVEATSNTEFTVSDPGRVWTATTQLSVRWYGRAASDRFYIELPAGAVWRAIPSTDFERYRIVPWDGPLAAESEELESPPRPPAPGARDPATDADGDSP